MSSSMLKIIACAIMLLDHIGAALFPQVRWIRLIGRLAFPIFAYLIAEGYARTKNFSKYLSRLLMFGLIAQIPFGFAFGRDIYINNFSDFIKVVLGQPMHLNIFFTLAIGLIAIKVYDSKFYLRGNAIEEAEMNNTEDVSGEVVTQTMSDNTIAAAVESDVIISKSRILRESKLAKFFIIAALGILTNVYTTDYSMYGVMMILAFYVFRDSKMKTIVSQILVYVIFGTGRMLYYYFTHPEYFPKGLQIGFFSQGLSILALIFIFLYNGKKGKDLKYFFYAFYPVHISILALIKFFVLK